MVELCRLPNELIEFCLNTTGDPMSANEPLPHLRFDIAEVAKILRISRATLYDRIRTGRINTHQYGRRTFVTSTELYRYVNAADSTH